MLGCCSAFSISASSLNLCLSALESFRSWGREDNRRLAESWTEVGCPSTLFTSCRISRTPKSNTCFLLLCPIYPLQAEGNSGSTTLCLRVDRGPVFIVNSGLGLTRALVVLQLCTEQRCRWGRYTHIRTTWRWRVWTSRRHQHTFWLLLRKHRNPCGITIITNLVYIQYYRK